MWISVVQVVFGVGQGTVFHVRERVDDIEFHLVFAFSVLDCEDMSLRRPAFCRSDGFFGIPFCRVTLIAGTRVVFCHGLGNPLVHGADGGPFVREAREGDVRVIIGFACSREDVHCGDGVLSDFVWHLDDPKLTKLDVLDEDGNSMTQGENAVFSADLSTGMITTNVVNYAGVKLPSTGGTGVYGIYVAGVVMALIGAGAVMVYGVNRKKKEVR